MVATKMYRLTRLDTLEDSIDGGATLKEAAKQSSLIKNNAIKEKWKLKKKVPTAIMFEGGGA